jgi:hypothetical protein
VFTVNPSTYVPFQNGLEVVTLLYLSCLVSFGAEKETNTEVMQSNAALNTVLVTKIL